MAEIIYCVLHSDRPATKEAIVTGARNPPVCDDCFSEWEAEVAVEQKRGLPHLQRVVQRRLLAAAQERDRADAEARRQASADSPPAALEPPGILPPHLIERDNQS
jgi:hypothetical protein